MVVDQKLRLKRHRYLSPSCCEAMRRTRAVVADESAAGQFRWYLRLLSNTGSGLEFSDMSLFEEERRWRDEHRDWGKDPFTPAPTHCPFCGAKLRAIVKKAAAPEPLCVYDDDGYCNTCGERAYSCLCWPPWAAYEEASS